MIKSSRLKTAPYRWRLFYAMQGECAFPVEPGERLEMLLHLHKHELDKDKARARNQKLHDS